MQGQTAGVNTNVDNEARNFDPKQAFGLISAAAKNWSTLAADCAPVGWLRSVVASRGTRPWVCRAVLFSTLDVLLLWVRVHDTTYLES
jgi:hypothetical protein